MYQASQKRYDHMNNFGSADPIANQKAIIYQAFDLGITYYNLANNYGPEPGKFWSYYGYRYAAIP